MAEKIAAVRPLRRAGRPSPERARAVFEAAGARALAEDDRSAASASARWLVRVYYRSAGGEILCFDAGPFARQTADRVAGLHAARQIFVEKRDRRTGAGMYQDHPDDPPSAEVLRVADAGAIAPGHSARLVVLPSQVAAAALEIEHDLANNQPSLFPEVPDAAVGT